MKVLIIEDDNSCAEQIKLVLGRIADFEIIQFPSVESTIGKLEDINPEFCIIDHKLNGVEGVSIIPLVRKGSKNCTIIMLSGQQDVGVVGEAIRKGANYYIEKDEKAFLKLQKYMTNEYKKKSSLNQKLRKIFGV